MMCVIGILHPRVCDTLIVRVTLRLSIDPEKFKTTSLIPVDICGSGGTLCVNNFVSWSNLNLTMLLQIDVRVIDKLIVW